MRRGLGLKGGRGLLVAVAALGLAGFTPNEANTNAKGDPRVSEIAVQSAAEWQSITRKNLFAMKQLLEAHTPIPLTGGDAAQEAWLTAGYQEALALIPQVRDELGLLYVLRRYALGFDDIHLDVRQAGASPINRWPGFVAARQGGETVVSWRQRPPLAGEPPVGARIISCDGAPIETLIEERLFRFWRARGFSTGYLQATTRLFFDNANGFFAPPSVCHMQWDGADHTVRLHWRDVDYGTDDFQTAYQTASGDTPAEWGITTPAPGVTWIGVPSFMDDVTQAVPFELVEIINQLREEGAAYRAGRAVVVDLRGNGGGLRSASTDLAEAVFGVDGARRAQRIYVSASWVTRISDDNVSDIMSGTVAAVEGPRPEGAPAQSARTIGWIYRGALRSNQESLVLGSPPRADAGGLTARRIGQPPQPAPDGARIYVLVNETCLSACLWFMDVAAFMPGVTLIGDVSGADGALTWARVADLPEAGMTLTTPMMELRGYARSPGEFYTPDIAYPGLWDDEAVRAWVLGLIDAERPLPLPASP